MLSKLSLEFTIITRNDDKFFFCLRYWNGCYDIYERTLNINKCTSSYISHYDSSNAGMGVCTNLLILCFIAFNRGTCLHSLKDLHVQAILANISE